MDKERFLKSGLLEQYVLGLTNAEDTAVVERYIKTFPDIRNKVASLKKEVEAYASMQLPNLEDAAKIQVKPSVRIPSWAVGVAASLFVACLFLANKWNTANNRMHASEQALAGCQTSYKTCLQTADMLAFLEHEDTRPVYLNGTDQLPKAKALVYWNHTAKSAYFNPLRLPQAPDGQQYQIWADVEGVMINMGLIDPKASHLQALRYIPEAQSLNITLEPIGGSEHPTVSRLCLNGDFLAAN